MRQSLQEIAEEIFRRKRLSRLEAARLPIEEKLRILVRLQERANAIRRDGTGGDVCLAPGIRKDPLTARELTPDGKLSARILAISQIHSASTAKLSPLHIALSCPTSIIARDKDSGLISHLSDRLTDKILAF
jgi:hypothetical protein